MLSKMQRFELTFMQSSNLQAGWVTNLTVNIDDRYSNNIN